VRLAGELALVTGSTAGIGKAIATRFAAEGAAVVVTGRNQERADAVVATVTAAGGVAHALLADLGVEAECARLVEHATDLLGGLTVLVNNAVASIVDDADGPIAELSTEAWDTSLRVNLSAPMWLCRAAVPHMIRAGHGSIVNISSRQAERASKGFTAYVASKAGLNGLTRAIAVDYAAAKIRANTISPGYVINERRDRDLGDERRARLEAMHLTRLGEADDVALAAVYLASHESGFVTGMNLPLDGGGSIARGAVLG
jgi:Dehydrogenases with different specificities (related to short-chain alcohol dehydrogenases)